METLYFKVKRINLMSGKPIFIKTNRNNLEELKKLRMSKYYLKKAEINIFQKNKH